MPLLRHNFLRDIYFEYSWLANIVARPDVTRTDVITFHEYEHSIKNICELIAMLVVRYGGLMNGK